MSDSPATAPLALAVVTRLEAAGLLAGYGKRPEGAGWPEGTPTDVRTFLGYVVVHGGVGGSFDGTVVKPSADGLQGVQLTCVGATPVEADDIRDRARAALLGQPLQVVEGRWVDLATLDDEQPARLDDTVKPNLFFAVDRFTFPTTPA